MTNLMKLAERVEAEIAAGDPRRTVEAIDELSAALSDLRGQQVSENIRRNRALMTERRGPLQ